MLSFVHHFRFLLIFPKECKSNVRYKEVEQRTTFPLSLPISCSEIEQVSRFDFFLLAHLFVSFPFLFHSDVIYH